MKNIKSWNEFQTVNELRTETYAKVMNRTEGYPWRMISKDDRGNYVNNPKAEQEGRVNTVARERFQTEFMKEFPEGSTTITINGMTYEFDGIKFESNSTNYYLIFKQERGSSMAYIHPHRTNGYFVEMGPTKLYSEDGDTGLDEPSEALIYDMLDYMRR